MGAVYLAEHPLIGKKVALKVIHRELAEQQGGRAALLPGGARGQQDRQRAHRRDPRLRRDARGRPLLHHGVPRGPAPSPPVLAQRDGRSTSMRALHVGAQIASALAAAHAAGVIHRDLKPDNVMLMTRLGDPDFVKVLDFGLAKMFAGGGRVGGADRGGRAARHAAVHVARGVREQARHRSPHRHLRARRSCCSR